MFARPVVVAAVLFLSSSSFGFAASSAIGTVSTRGEIRVGGYSVKGTATLFDNTAVETNEFAATLRLDKGTEIKLGAGSSGTLFHDRLVLSRGVSELTTNTPFQLVANGLNIQPGAPGTSGTVAVSQENTVEVAALTGELRVTNNQGAVLARVSPGAAVSLSAVPGAAAPSFSDIGLVSLENGHFYLSSSQTGVKYEITGNGISHYVGQKVIIAGKLLNGTEDQPILVQVTSIETNGGKKGLTTLDKILIGTTAAAIGAGIGYAVSSSSR